MAAFGSLLKRYRLAAGLTHEALAERSNLSARTISDLERGISQRPRPETVVLLIHALQLAPAHSEALIAAARPPPPTIKPAALPVPLTSFIGRERETRALRSLLRRAGTRLVTLTGAGGVGKTRLAIQTAWELHDTFEAGAEYVALAPVANIEGVMRAILRVTDATHADSPEPLKALLETFGSKEVLLLLDNFEHVLDAAPLLAELLQHCPHLRVLVTSRSALRLSFEQEFPVEPLATPDIERLPVVEDVANYPAVALFVERTTRVRPEFALTENNAPDVAAICARLDGLPLAVELAAARMKFLSPGALLARLDGGSAHPRLELLTGGPRDWPQRHQTLRNTVAWSYDLLDPDDQRLLQWLAVFSGGWTLEAATAICGSVIQTPDDEDRQTHSILNKLAALVDQSLVYQARGTGGEPRFAMLETIREFALEQLNLADEEEAARRQHAQYYLALVETTGALLFATALKRKRTADEHDNIQAALRWLVQHG